MIKHTLHLTIEDSVFKNIKSESITKWMDGSNTGICDQLIKHIVTAIDSGDDELEIISVKENKVETENGTNDSENEKLH